MKKLLIISAIFLWAVSCNKPKTIPDREMPLLVRDLIVANAYSASNLPGIGSDTIDIYSPIFVRYGYTDVDFRHTLNEMASKKSSRFSEIVDSVIADIARDNNFYRWRRSVRETIDSLAEAKYRDTVYVMDSVSIRVDDITQNIVDKKYTIRIPVRQSGEYRFDMKYRIDTTDKRNMYTLRHYLDRGDSVERRPGTSSYIRSSAEMKRTMAFTVRPSSTDSTLVVRLLTWNKNIRKPVGITLDSIYVVYYPPIAETRRRLAEEMSYSFFKTPSEDETTQKDSGALYTAPPLRPDTTGRADILR